MADGQRSGSPSAAEAAGVGTPPPALALVELGSIARGHRVVDAMLKRAPVTLLGAEWVSPGKYLVLVAGDVASVDESFRVGVEVGASEVIDRLILPQAHPQLWPALRGERTVEALDSLAVVETITVAASLAGADAACKAAAVRIIEMQLARGIGGKAFFTITGPLGEVEAALEAAVDSIGKERLQATETIPAPHEDLTARLR